ncbi:hypothetical protein BU24DRAFT_473521 [Aaosphaeria arxii CBS 175.79]|uniref:mRNA N(6)-methyladenine demethylase n=1 Tax=Aaosphaeria arxii CBS 175.79 TaxID=1450172 RepID=A0A6A5X9F9_9PLEO|nr:uncharacterized protein BU24DRAFT_473521 [Aaosphaeria arxii CBS 175.79]KAF2009384.1 hypothetical protein BU24DRAFT_473521 [Aaosphaeria arxii CBS 175.79]
MENLDPHQRPPDGIRNVYKKYQKLKLEALNRDAEIVDPHDPSDAQRSKIAIVQELETEFIFKITSNTSTGLHIIPNLLPPEIQQILLHRLLHRDLSNPSHLTNIHTHYKLSYPPHDSSFFSFPPSSQDHIAHPLDPSVHKPLTVSQLLNRKMRWTTLGGQYDWTAKRYPDAPPPTFPPDIKDLLEAIFTDTKAEAAIVNLYSAGDTLSVHRDVAEFCDTGLVSVSLGCDAVFVIGIQEDGGEEKILTLRLRSGSAVYMSGKSRFAWHGVPQVVGGTCPEYLKDWPAGEGREGGFEEWAGWMATKRINLNVRQMWA